MLDRKRKDACCAGWGAGEKMLLSADVESEKMRNSLMSGFPSMVSRISLEACDCAIISALCELALSAKGTLWVKRTRPAWMPVMAQPAALSVLDPSVKTQSVCRPSWREHVQHLSPSHEGRELGPVTGMGADSSVGRSPRSDFTWINFQIWYGMW